MEKTEIKDMNGRPLTKGDVFNLHQTVNGCYLFVALEVNPLDIRYAYDLNRKYEYDKQDLFKPCKYSGETETEIVANIYTNFLNEM